ncbi:alcohol dehydrogenase catalytic domain-containing protein [Nocardioides humi]|uniref:Zinc-binding dehydrogenase n=1 Tax=Nocardioides humi TaxID=449461 RepID=A0ABN2B385_9ACTN|nr:alcohol dehydrogenase catalytic domain-containing protein [Nocardioides humi]
MTDQMWAYRLQTPTLLAQTTAPMPSADTLVDGEVLVRLLAGGICGSDLPYFKGDHNPVIPMVDESNYAEAPAGASLHEIVGEVVASRDSTLAEGSRVVGWATAMDGLAEYVVTQGSSLAIYDSALLPTSAVMLQPLACVIYAVEQMGPVKDERVAVLGLGPIGLLFSHVLKTAGAGEVSGVDKIDRSDVAQTFLIDQPVHSTVSRWASRPAGTTGPTRLVEAIGHQVNTLTSAVRAIEPHGEIYYFGVPDDQVYPFPMWDFLRKNLVLRSGTTYERRAMLHRAGEYIQRHPELLDAYVTDVYPIDDAQKAFESATAPARGRLKIVLEV